MKNNISKVMLEVFKSKPNIQKSLFLSSFFNTKPSYITEAQEIEIDVVREDEDIAPVIYKNTGAYLQSREVYTNKKFKPPKLALKEEFNPDDQIKVQAGETEYEAATANQQARLMMKVADSWESMINRMKRTIELQASQILTTGELSLKDEENNVAYTIDFQPKTALFPTVFTAWSDTGADGIGDLEGLADEIRDNGLVDAVNIIMDPTSFKNFLAQTKTEKYFNKEGLNLGALAPELRNNGAKLQGFVDVGAYSFNIWTYNARYKDIDGTKKLYTPANKVIMLPDMMDLDFRKCFCGIPQIVETDARFRSMLPSQVVINGAYSFKPRIFVDNNDEIMYSEVKSKPILIPTSIDRFGCLTTTV